MNHLNVLYASDENYAPFLGVSMYSLFYNNKNIEKITVYAVLDNVSKNNVNKLTKVAEDFGRELIIVDAKEFNVKIEKLGIPKYRGNYTTNYRLFFDEIIKPDAKHLLYLDCDTIVNSSLDEIFDMQMQDKCILCVRDPLTKKYKNTLGFKITEDYFNAGVLFINVDNWKSQEVTTELLSYIMNIRSKFCNPDQDLLNIILKDKKIIIDPKFNFMATHSAFDSDVYGKVYGFDNYYSKETLDNSKNNVVIYHMYRFLGQFPWHKNNFHPNTKLFDCYLKQSPWNDYKKQTTKLNNIFFMLERMAYKILPKTFFLLIFRQMQETSLKKQNKKLLKICK